MTQAAWPDRTPAEPKDGAGTCVTSASLADARERDAFVASAPGGVFYHLSGWLSVMHDSMGQASFGLVARHGDRIVGALPLILVSSRLLGRMLVAVPFLNHGGICAESRSVASLLLEEAVTCTRTTCFTGR